MIRSAGSSQHRVIAGGTGALLALTMGGSLVAQSPPAGGTAQPRPPAQATFPAQQRPPGDPELIARGETLYTINCRSCHGIDLRGGELGGPNLLRSPVVLNDQEGDLLEPVLRDGMSSRPGMPSMPPQPLSSRDIRAVAEYIHSVAATMQRQGAPPAGASFELNVLVGDPNAGEEYFRAKCSACHSTEGDLRGIGTRIPDPVELQNTWVRGGPNRRANPSARPPITVMVTQPSGEVITGELERLDDFIVALTDAEGRRRSFSRTGSIPTVRLSDPLAGHTELLTVYRDKDIHDVTAYLMRLK